MRAAGTNCDEETAYAWELAGANPERVHINRLLEKPASLREYEIITFPGGFSFGDDIAAGRILANQLVHHLGDELRRFVEDGKLVLGICNGFQVLVQAGLLPGTNDGSGPKRRVTLTINGHGRFEARWVWVRAETDRSVWLEQGEMLRLPIAHAEGRVLTDGPETLAGLERAKAVAVRYVDASGKRGGFGVNPNGSDGDVAGLIDVTGRVLGLMPHPERDVHPQHAPIGSAARAPDGRRIFERAVRYLRTV